MKKLISLILVLVLALALSGCGEDNPNYMIDDWEREDRLEFIDGLRMCYDSNFDNEECLVDDARFYTKDELDNYINELEDRLDDIESVKTYNREQIELIIYSYELQKSIALIENNALDEGRGLTNEELLLIASYELLLNQVDID